MEEDGKQVPWTGRSRNQRSASRLENSLSNCRTQGFPRGLGAASSRLQGLLWGLGAPSLTARAGTRLSLACLWACVLTPELVPAALEDSCPYTVVFCSWTQRLFWKRVEPVIRYKKYTERVCPHTRGKPPGSGAWWLRVVWEAGEGRG